MPTYEYYCFKCGRQFEKQHGMSEKLKECPMCGGDIARILQPSTFHLKGSGFHDTDYDKNGPKRK